MLERLIIKEEFFAVSEYFGQLEKEEVFRYCNRNSKVLLSAPHATRTFVNNRNKAADLYTGSITQMLGEVHNFSTIVRTKYVPDLIKIIDFVEGNQLGEYYFLDIHGMDINREFELAVGTGYFTETNYKKELDFLRSLADKYQVKMVINHPDYTGKCGLTGDYQKIYKQPKVLQLEWRKDFRSFYLNPEKVLEKTMPMIKELADFLSC